MTESEGFARSVFGAGDTITTKNDQNQLAVLISGALKFSTGSNTSL